MAIRSIPSLVSALIRSFRPADALSPATELDSHLFGNPLYDRPALKKSNIHQVVFCDFFYRKWDWFGDFATPSAGVPCNYPPNLVNPEINNIHKSFNV
jgi:hypothetical protein